MLFRASESLAPAIFFCIPHTMGGVCVCVCGWVVSTSIQPARAPACQIVSKSVSLPAVWGKLGEKEGGGSGGCVRASKPQTCMPAGRSLPALGGRISAAIVPAPCPERWSDSAERQIPQTALHMQLKAAASWWGERRRGEGKERPVPYYAAVQSSAALALCRRPRERIQEQERSSRRDWGGNWTRYCGVMLHGPITCSCLEDLSW